MSLSPQKFRVTLQPCEPETTPLLNSGPPLFAPSSAPSSGPSNSLSTARPTCMEEFRRLWLTCTSGSVVPRSSLSPEVQAPLQVVTLRSRA